MSTSKLTQIKFTLIFFISFFIIITTAKLTYIHQNCYNLLGSYEILSGYGVNIDKSIAALISKASTSYYDTHTSGTGAGKVNAYYSCRYDVSPQVCQSCVASAADNSSTWCIGSLESLVVYEECTLHYSYRKIFSVMEDVPQLYEFSMSTEDNEVRFNKFLDSRITGLIKDTASSSPRYFATKTSEYSNGEIMYALAQCNPDITSFECKTCLQNGFRNFTANYTSRSYGQVFLPSCRLSYVLTSDKPSSPWEFALIFNQNRRPTLIPGATIPTFSSSEPSSVPETSNPEPSSVPESSNLGPSFDPGSSNLEPSSIPESSFPGPSFDPGSSNLEPSSVPGSSNLGPSSVPETSKLGPSSIFGSSNLEPSSVPISIHPGPSSVPGSSKFGSSSPPGSDIESNPNPESSNLEPSSFLGSGNIGSAGTRASSTFGAMITIIFFVAKFFKLLV